MKLLNPIIKQWYIIIQPSMQIDFSLTESFASMIVKLEF